MTLSPAAMNELDQIKVRSTRKTETNQRDGRRPPINVGKIIRAASVSLGFNPVDTRFFNRYIADMENEHVHHVTCIRCGAVGLKRRSVSVADPAQMLRDLAELNGKIRPMLVILRRKGRSDIPADKNVVLYNGFCGSCVESMDENMPPAFRFDSPGENDFEILKCLVAECVRFGATQEAIYDLARIVREHTAPDREEEKKE